MIINVLEKKAYQDFCHLFDVVIVFFFSTVVTTIASIRVKLQQNIKIMLSPRNEMIYKWDKTTKTKQQKTEVTSRVTSDACCSRLEVEWFVHTFSAGFGNFLFSQSAMHIRFS